MSAAREEILGKLRGALKRGPLTGERAAQLEARLNNHPAGIVPRRSEGLDRAGLTALFEQEGTAIATTMERVNLPSPLAGEGDGEAVG